MSLIDLIILGIVSEKPQSAYDIQKDVEYHHLDRWTKISTPSIYKKVITLKEKNYLTTDVVKNGKFAEKSIYSITNKGIEYFQELMEKYSDQEITIPINFNVVISNLNKIPKPKALELINKIRNNIIKAQENNKKYTELYSDIPLTGRTIFKQQEALYSSLLDWMSEFETEFLKDLKNGE